VYLDQAIISNIIKIRLLEKIYSRGVKMEMRRDMPMAQITDVYDVVSFSNKICLLVMSISDFSFA